MKYEPENNYNYVRCFGSGILPDEEKCPVTNLHKVKCVGDTAGYNGVRHWRCPACFTEHRKKVRDKNK